MAWGKKVIEILEDKNRTYKIDFATKIKESFCNNSCYGRNCSKCSKCAVEWAYETAVKEIKLGIRTRPIVVAEYCSSNYGAYRAFDGKGHKTEVWRVSRRKGGQ